ncbi:hypothetical protein ACWGE1_23670 [Streptomyces sp. NPDC054932]
MRTTVIRVLATLATSAAVVMMTTTGASAATPPGTAAGAPAHLTPAGVPAWDHIGEFSRSECIWLRDSYVGKAKCVRNAGGLYDLYLWV